MIGKPGQRKIELIYLKEKLELTESRPFHAVSLLPIRVFTVILMAEPNPNDVKSPVAVEEAGLNVA